MQFAVALIAVLVASTAVAQYPTRAVTILNGFPPGGPTDLTLRQVSAKLAERLGQAVVIENRAGASGTIAAAAVAKAPADGYTLLFAVAGNMVVAPAALASVPYDPVKSFTPIIEIARGPYLWLVRPNNPARNMTEFVAWAKAQAKPIAYGSPGIGTVHQFAAETLKRIAGMPMLHVPYKGGTTAYTAMLGGEIEAMFDGMPAPLAHLRAGKMRALGVTGPKRLAAVPDVPTLAEQGIPGIDVHFWWGFVGPAGLPRETVTRLHAEIGRALADPELAKTFANWSIDISTSTPEAFGAFIAQEAGRWRELVASSGVKLE